MNASDLPDQICIVLTPQASKSGDGQIGQSGAVTLETIDITAYLPIYTDYQIALQENPNCPIYVMSLVDFKRRLGMPI